MKVVVTGASGHLGCVLVRQLLSHGHEVVAFSSNATTAISLSNLPIKKTDGDVRDAAALQACFEGADIVIHLAALIHVEDHHSPEMDDVNINGAKLSAEVALQAGVKRFIYVSSVHAFQHHPFDVPLNETRARVTDDHPIQYDRTKVHAERAIKSLIEKGLDVVVLNPCGIIGPDDYLPSHMGKFIRLILQKKMPFAVGGGFNWVDVRDVSRSIIASIDKGRSGENYLLAGHWCSILDIFNAASKLVNGKQLSWAFPIRLVMMSMPIIKRIRPLLHPDMIITGASMFALQSNRQIDDSKARRELGHQTRPLSESLYDVHVWFESQNGLLPSSENEKLAPREALS